MVKDSALKEFSSVTTNNYSFRNTIDYNGDIIDFDKVFAEKENNLSILGIAFTFIFILIYFPKTTCFHLYLHIWFTFSFDHYDSNY